MIVENLSHPKNHPKIARRILRSFLPHHMLDEGSRQKTSKVSMSPVGWAIWEYPCSWHLNYTCITRFFKMLWWYFSLLNIIQFGGYTTILTPLLEFQKVQRRKSGNYLCIIIFSLQKRDSMFLNKKLVTWENLCLWFFGTGLHDYWTTISCGAFRDSLVSLTQIWFISPFHLCMWWGNRGHETRADKYNS